MPRFIALSGPSCVGKSPLFKALRRVYPDAAFNLKKVILYNDRQPRPGEQDCVDYYFRPRSEIDFLRRRGDCLVVPVRGDLQALDLESVKRILQEGHDALYEGNPFIVSALRDSAFLAEIPSLAVFLSPLSREEILYFHQPDKRVDLAVLIADIMRRKLLRRTQSQKGILSDPDLKNIEIRCNSAFVEMQEAWKFDYVIPNHDGEDSEHWNAFYYPIGEARRALEAFAGLIRGEGSPHAEQWEEGLL